MIQIVDRRKVKHPIRLCLICKVSGANTEVIVEKDGKRDTNLVHSRCIEGRKESEILKLLHYPL